MILVRGGVEFRGNIGKHRVCDWGRSPAMVPVGNTFLAEGFLTYNRYRQRNSPKESAETDGRSTFRVAGAVIAST